MALSFILNGTQTKLDTLADPAGLEAVVDALGLQAGRIALEHNGVIIPRSRWHLSIIHQDDRLEVVHFVGGGR